MQLLSIIIIINYERVFDPVLVFVGVIVDVPDLEGVYDGVTDGVPDLEGVYDGVTDGVPDLEGV